MGGIEFTKSGVDEGAPEGSSGVSPRAVDVPSAVRGLGELSTYVIDPITGLISFPNFNAVFPDLINGALGAGHQVGLAVGDVDNMKSYVERKRAADDLCFGHLAGNALMSELGAIALGWFSGSPIERGCLTTFGGDEIVLLTNSLSQQELLEQVSTLAGKLTARLPCSVSFAYGMFEGGRTFRRLSHSHCRETLVTIDRALFALKQERPGETQGDLADAGRLRIGDEGWGPVPAEGEGGSAHASAAACG